MDWWTSPDVLQTLARRDVGHLFRMIQKITKASQTRIGAATGLNQAQVSEIMSGRRHVTTLDVASRIIEGLAIPEPARTVLLLGNLDHASGCLEQTRCVSVQAANAPSQQTTQATRTTPAMLAYGEPGRQHAVEGDAVLLRTMSERSVGLRPHIDRAFTERRVTVDFSGFSGETLHGTLQEPLDKVRVGQYTPESIHVRALILDTAIPWHFPCDRDTLGDDPEFRRRMHRLSVRHSQAVIDSVEELLDMGLVGDASVEIRVHNLTPLFKLYVLNGRDVFFGFYPVTEFLFKIDDQQHAVFNLMGKDQTLFRFARANESGTTVDDYVRAAQSWFDSIWTTVAREFSA